MKSMSRIPRASIDLTLKSTTLVVLKGFSVETPLKELVLCEDSTAGDEEELLVEGGDGWLVG